MFHGFFVCHVGVFFRLDDVQVTFGKCCKAFGCGVSWQVDIEGGGSMINYHGPPKPIFLEVFMVNNLVFRWPKPLFFMVLGAHGSWCYGRELRNWAYSKIAS